MDCKADTDENDVDQTASKDYETGTYEKRCARRPAKTARLTRTRMRLTRRHARTARLARMKVRCARRLATEGRTSPQSKQFSQFARVRGSSKMKSARLPSVNR